MKKTLCFLRFVWKYFSSLRVKVLSFILYIIYIMVSCYLAPSKKTHPPGNGILFSPNSGRRYAPCAPKDQQEKMANIRQLPSVFAPIRSNDAKSLRHVAISILCMLCMFSSLHKDVRPWNMKGRRRTKNNNIQNYVCIGNISFSHDRSIINPIGLHLSYVVRKRSLEVVSYWHDPQLQVDENYFRFDKMEVNYFQILRINVMFFI